MHIVPQQQVVFGLTTRYDLPIPPAALAVFEEDRATPETPRGLRDLRHALTDLEDGVTEITWFIPLSDIEFDRTARVVPLVTVLSLELMVRGIFTAWQRTRMRTRRGYRLAVTKHTTLEGEGICMRVTLDE